MKKYRGFDLLLGSLFMALALIFPIVFHTVGLGSAFLPMFYPIILGGFLISLPVAISVGILTPITSALLTGMPPLFPPIAFIMTLEGLVLSGMPATLYQKFKINLWLTLIITLFFDRLLVLATVILIARWLNLPEDILGITAVIKGLPGIIIIMLIVPPLIKKMRQKLNTMALLDEINE